MDYGDVYTERDALGQTNDIHRKHKWKKEQKRLPIWLLFIAIHLLAFSHLTQRVIIIIIIMMQNYRTFVRVCARALLYVRPDSVVVQCC